MKKSLSLFLLFFIFGNFLHSEVQHLNFPILGFRTIPIIPIPTECDFDESWFGENSSRVYHHGICRIACLFAETSYLDIIEFPDRNQIHEVYRVLGFSEENIEFHYEDVDYTNKWGINQCAVSYGLKAIKSSLGEKNLVVMNIRGTPLSHYEWLSNLNLSDTTQKDRPLHEGYDISADQMKESLVDFFNRRKLDSKDTFIIITGHSRGASVANMLGAKLADDTNFNQDMIYCYPFGCSNVTTNDDYNDPKYSFIWNISNGEDLVPTTPPNYGIWKYKKYGNEKTLISRWGAKDPAKYETEMLPKMSAYYEKYLCRPYEPFRAGKFFPSQLGYGFDVLFHGMGQFYRKFLGFRNTGEFVFKKIFPPDQKKVRETEDILATKKRNIVDVANDWTHNLIFTYANRCVDMHACESYMSWLMLFDEDEVYTDLESLQMVLHGDVEGAILNEKGDVLIEFRDGSTIYKADRTQKIPAVALTLPGRTVIGLPKNEKFTFKLYKDSIIPSPISIQFENHDVMGNAISVSEKKYFNMGKGRAISFATENFDFSAADENYEFGKKEISVSEFKESTGINPLTDFTWNIQASWNFDGTPELGFNLGTNLVYGSILFEFNRDFFSLNPGIGHRETLFAHILLDFGLFGKCRWEDGFDFTPSARISLAVKPFHRFQVFVAGIFDFDTEDFGVSPDCRIGLRL